MTITGSWLLLYVSHEARLDVGTNSVEICVSRRIQHHVGSGI